MDTLSDVIALPTILQIFGLSSLADWLTAVIKNTHSVTEQPRFKVKFHHLGASPS